MLDYLGRYGYLSPDQDGAQRDLTEIIPPTIAVFQEMAHLPITGRLGGGYSNLNYLYDFTTFCLSRM